MTHIKLTSAEIQSGTTRQNWAEDLIAQLPVDHDGRNSWIMNYGTSIEAINRRATAAGGVRFDTEFQAAMPAGRKECPRYDDCERGVAECYCGD